MSRLAPIRSERSVALTKLRVVTAMKRQLKSVCDLVCTCRRGHEWRACSGLACGARGAARGAVRDAACAVRRARCGAHRVERVEAGGEQRPQRQHKLHGQKRGRSGERPPARLRRAHRASSRTRLVRGWRRRAVGRAVGRAAARVCLSPPRAEEAQVARLEEEQVGCDHHQRKLAQLSREGCG